MRNEEIILSIITRFDPTNAQKAHNDSIIAGPVFPAGLSSPFDHAWVYLNGPGAMEPHTHHKEEVYIFTKGNGYVVVNDTFYPVGPGDVVYIPPDALHSVVNEEEGELMWAAFWWDIVAPREKNGNPVKEEDLNECNVFNDR